MPEMNVVQFDILNTKIDKLTVALLGDANQKGLFERVRNLEWFYRIPLLISLGLNIFFGIVGVLSVIKGGI